ncbi:MAG TPA: hypothetical protein VHB79_10800 [Polyangiaceae bacterium]|nr:hypothetical protein [Polyangiaceae bacterium]
MSNAPHTHHRPNRQRLERPWFVQRQILAQSELTRARNMMIASNAAYQRALAAAREAGLDPRY